MATAGLAKAAGTSIVETAGDEGGSGGWFVEAVAVAGNMPDIAENCELYMTAGVDEVGGSSKRAYDDWSALRTWLQQLSKKCGSEEELGTTRSRPTWTEFENAVSEVSSSAELEAQLDIQNRDLFEHLMNISTSEFCKNRPWGRPLGETPAREITLAEFEHLGPRETPFFWDFKSRLQVGRRIGGGGQADVYEAVFDGHVTEFALKVFRSGSSLTQLRRLWIWTRFTQYNVKEYRCYGKRDNYCVILHGTMLKDNRFAFVMERYWGDLRKAIDLQIVKDMKTHQNPPFPLSISIWIMHEIAKGMGALHQLGILHRDLKAANVLLTVDIGDYVGGTKLTERNVVLNLAVADYETPGGIMGTGFWRAPEILHALKSKAKNIHLDPTIWTEKVDVYSYAMTSYEVLTGCIPFRNRALNDYDGVISGERPPLPNYVDDEIEELVRRCWHSEPCMRPTFREIEDELNAFIRKRREVSKSMLERERDDEAKRWLDKKFFWFLEDKEVLQEDLKEEEKHLKP